MYRLEGIREEVKKEFASHTSARSENIIIITMNNRMSALPGSHANLGRGILFEFLVEQTILAFSL